MTPAQHAAHTAALEARRQERCLEALAETADENVVADAVAQPNERDLGVHARLGDATFPVSADRVREVIEDGSARGGVRKLANSLRQQQVIYVEDTGETYNKS